MSKFEKENSLQMSHKVILRFTQICGICIFLFLGGARKIAHFDGQKCQNSQKLIFAPNTAKSNLGVKMAILGVKSANICQKIFVPKSPQRQLGVSHYQNGYNLHISGVKNAHLGVQILFNDIFGMKRCRPTNTLKCGYQICTSKIKMIQIRVCGGEELPSHLHPRALCHKIWTRTLRVKHLLGSRLCKI